MVTAIIQARMTSTRLPCKVLKEVLGRPLLSYQIERLRQVKDIKQIVVATTMNKEDNPIAVFCKKEGVYLYRGSEHDVLDRYCESAILYHADPIIRVTADCPLIDPNVYSAMIENFSLNSFDYIRTGQSFAEGLDCEILSLKNLIRSDGEALLPSEREHVTLYIRNHPELFRIKIIENKSDDSRYRITVDEPQDLEVVGAIIKSLYPKNPHFGIKDIKLFLDDHPEIFTLNSAVIRNEWLLKSLINKV